MKQISVREFQKNATKGLAELPVVLTRYNVPVAVIHPIKNYVGEDGTHRITEVEITKPSEGFCQGHFEEGVKHPIEYITYESVNGEVAWQKWLCPKCIKSTELKIQQEGGRLIKK